jgi:Spx/MgsR family transcriptional regulator
MTLYGIKHCDKVRQARKHLESAGLVYDFVDFDENAPTETTIRRWLEHVPIKTLFNTRSTTYRELDLKNRELSDNEKIALMAKYNRLIKRPVLEVDGNVVVGFDTALYGDFIEKG